MAAINIQRAEFHGEWNYTISPDPIAQIARLSRDGPYSLLEGARFELPVPGPERD